jgi:hypothetical protein
MRPLTLEQPVSGRMATRASRTRLRLNMRNERDGLIGKRVEDTDFRARVKRPLAAVRCDSTRIPMLEGMRWRKMLSGDDMRKAEVYP